MQATTSWSTLAHLSMNLRNTHKNHISHLTDPIPGLENPEEALEWVHRGPYEHRYKKALVKPMAANLEVNHQHSCSWDVAHECFIKKIHVLAALCALMQYACWKQEPKCPGAPPTHVSLRSFIQARVPCLDKDLEGLPVPRVFARQPAQCVRCK